MAQPRRRIEDRLALTEDVVEQAKHGDPEAVAVLYVHHVRMVHGYLRACGVPDADDLTSEVFVSMVRSLRRFDGDLDQFRSWLMTIAHHRLVDNRRKYFTERTIAVAEIEAMEESSKRVSLLNPILPSSELNEALLQLTPAQREVLALRFVADMSIETVAAITGRPISAVKSLQHRALSALRRSDELAVHRNVA